MKNIMTLLKEQKEAKRCSKKKDKGYRRILYPKTKADLMAGKNMNRIIGKAINNYQEFTRSAVLRGILKPSVSSVDRDEELQDIDTVDTAQDSSITELDTVIIKHTDITEVEIISSLSTTDQSTVITYYPVLARHELSIDKLNTFENQITSDLEISQISAFDTDESAPLLSESLLTETEYETPVVNNSLGYSPQKISLLLTIIEKTSYVNLGSRLRLLKYGCKFGIFEFNSGKLSCPHQRLPRRSNKLSPVVSFVKLPTLGLESALRLSKFNKVVDVTGCENLDMVEGNTISRLKTLNKSPVANYPWSSATDQDLISRLRKFNKSPPVVNFANSNTVEADIISRLSKFNNPPMVSFIKGPISKSQKFNKSSPVVNELRKSPKLQNLNSFPVVNYVYANTADPQQSIRSQNLNNAPVVSFIKGPISKSQKFNKSPPVVNELRKSPKLQNLNSFPVVDFTHLSTTDRHLISRLQNLNKSPPVVRYPNLNVSDLNTIPELRNLNNAPVVSFIELNTADPNKTLKLQNFNNPPVVNDAKLNAVEPNPFPELRNLNKPPPVVSFIKTATSKIRTSPKLRNLNKPPPVIKTPIRSPTMQKLVSEISNNRAPALKNPNFKSLPLDVIIALYKISLIL